MVKNKFYKNLFHSISWGISCIVLILATISGYFMSLQYGENYGWILLVFSASVVLLFFVIGFYWIFQTVEIDQQGISVKILRKTIKTIVWSDVVAIEEKTVMKNPVYAVTTRNRSCLNLDKRKKILDAIVYYGNDQIEAAIRLIR